MSNNRKLVIETQSLEERLLLPNMLLIQSDIYIGKWFCSETELGSHVRSKSIATGTNKLDRHRKKSFRWYTGTLNS